MSISVVSDQICVDGKPVCPVAQANDHFQVVGQRVMYRGKQVGTAPELSKAISQMPERVQNLRERFKRLRTSDFSPGQKKDPT